MDYSPRRLGRIIENMRSDIRRRRQLLEQRNSLRKHFGKISKRMARRFKKYLRLELFMLWDRGHSSEA